MCETEYNGWTNRETWATALHLSNDEALYNEALSLVAASPDCLREWVEDQVEAMFHEDVVAPRWVRMMAADVGSFWRVDWDEVAKSFEEEAS